LAIEIDISLPAARVVRTLEQLEDIHGLPQAIRLDNGSELRSAIFMGWCEEKGIELKFIQPGKPQQNAFIERFNKTYRHEVLNAYLFENLREVREITENWMVDSTTKCNFEQLVKEAKDVLVSKASRPASQSSHDLSTP
jgi:putative transposase